MISCLKGNYNQCNSEKIILIPSINQFGFTPYWPWSIWLNYLKPGLINLIMSSQLKEINAVDHTRSDSNIKEFNKEEFKLDPATNQNKDTVDKKRVNINDLLKGLKHEQKKSRTLNMVICFTLLSLIAVIGIIFSL